MEARENILKRLETFALQHGLRDKSERCFGGHSFGTVFRGDGYSVAVEFPDHDYVVVEIARKEIIGGVPFVVTIPVREFGRVIGDKKGAQERDSDFQMRMLESHTSPWLAGDHSIEARVHRRVRRAIPAQ
jgi:hypothetical protein